MVFSPLLLVCVRQKGSMQSQGAETGFLRSFPEGAGSSVGECAKPVPGAVGK